MTLFMAGFNYRTTPLELREQLALEPSQLVSRARQLQEDRCLEEIVLLSTCNRLEVYGVTPRTRGDIDALFELVGAKATDLRPHAYLRESSETLRHLFRVTAGLDSMFLGETEITGQVKDAYRVAHGARLTGSVLNRLFQGALRTAKEIRTNTAIGRGATSVGSVIADLAAMIFQHELANQSVMIIGAGQMGESCLRHLVKRGARSILVANRSPERAVQLSDQFSGRAVKFENCLQAMAEADIVIVSTASPNALLHRIDIQRVMDTRRHRPLFLIDISVPRNIEPAVHTLDNVFLYNIDDLEAIVRENVRIRALELTSCHQIIDARASALSEKLQIEKPGSLRLPCTFLDVEFSLP